jgi:hypothetical protein
MDDENEFVAVATTAEDGVLVVDVVVDVLLVLWRDVREECVVDAAAGDVLDVAAAGLFHIETSIAIPSSNDTIRGCEVSRLIDGGEREEEENVVLLLLLCCLKACSWAATETNVGLFAAPPLSRMLKLAARKLPKL